MTTSVASSPTTATKTASQLAYLTRVLRAPAIGDSLERLADTAQEEGRSHEEYLAAVLGREVATREAHGAEARIRRAGLPPRKSLKEFDFAQAPDLDRELVVHLGMADFVAAKSNVVLLGPPGTGKTALAAALTTAPPTLGTGSRSPPPPTGVMRLARAHNTGAANLVFHLIASRYETASTIVTSNRAFGHWSEIFGDKIVAAAIVDRLVHHADVIALNGDS